MNIIQRQTDDFIMYKMRDHRNYKEFIDDVRSELWEYKKDSYKIEFLHRIIQKAKIEFDNHMQVCTNKKSCSKNKFYENTLFFLQQELEEIEQELDPDEFTLPERNPINETLQKITNEINLLKLGQEITYDDLKVEFEELKDLYYLNKKNWLQLFFGKLTEMIASGVINETAGKDLIEIIKTNYRDLIAS